MIFHCTILNVILTLFTSINCVVFCAKADYASENNFNRTLFIFEDVKNCAKHQFYDFNIFQCRSCMEIKENFRTTQEKFSCGCRTWQSSTTVKIYDAVSPYITCLDVCSENFRRSKITYNTSQLIDEYCQNNETVLPSLSCRFKYINHTIGATSIQSLGDFSRKIEVAHNNWQYDGLCHECNMQYNFKYQGYCIANSLLRPYLSYNSFWQTATFTQHFGELKFVAFFCMTLKNLTACNQLANLCVLSHFASDKNSPCNKFLLNQATDALNRYGSADDLMAQDQMEPFLYYRKGKEGVAELDVPIKELKYSMKTPANRLKFFVNTYALDGTLLRWGSLKLNDLNLCQHHRNSWSFVDFLKFAHKYDAAECTLTLADLIDLAMINANNRFTTLFLNYTHTLGHDDNIFLQTIPVLIQDITAENKRAHKEDWQLVKRFQLIQYYPRHSLLATKATPSYEDSHKLLLFRSLRYADSIEIHYDIYDNNRISIPILKLHYRHIEFTSPNISLNTKYNFKLQITFERIGEADRGELFNDIALSLSLFLALMTAFFQANKIRKRRSSFNTPNIAKPQPLATAQQTNDNFCNFNFFTDFLLSLISSLALAFLICFLLHVFINSLSFLSQDNVELTLPIVKDQWLSQIIIYAAFILKLVYICVYFWRLSHFHIFFIDWERPRCGEAHHFNLRNNLETSSVCSSVRTFITDSNVSAWRTILLANEWIQLSGKRKTSKIIQGLAMMVLARLLDIDKISYGDTTIKIFYISLLYILIYIGQYLIASPIFLRICGNPSQKYIEHCSLANVSVFTLIEPSYGFYIHGRSPHGFADADITTMIMQLHRETHSICGRRGLLSDTDQCYVIMPPRNLSNYFDKLLLPYQASFGCAVGNTAVASNGDHFQKEINHIEDTLERTSIAYCSVNRFFCAFIDHGIKDMDYIIKEKTILERLLGCEFENYLTDNKGTFYIDTCFSFTRLFLYGNELQLFVLDFLLLLAVYLIFSNLLAAVVADVVFNKIFQMVYRCAVKENISNKTLIDKRFLM